MHRIEAGSSVFGALGGADLCLADGECVVYVRALNLAVTDYARMKDISSAAMLLFDDCIDRGELEGGIASRVGK